MEHYLEQGNGPEEEHEEEGREVLRREACCEEGQESGQGIPAPDLIQVPQNLRQRFRHWRIATLVLIATTVSAAEICPSTVDADPRPVFDAALLKEGRFTYRTSVKGESLGNTVIEVRRVGTNYRITMSAADIGQSWQATVRPSFAPLSAHLEMRSRGAPYAMDLTYEGARITGEERRSGAAKPVSVTSDGIVIDQRVDWAAMMTIGPSSGKSVTMRVFDPSTGFSQMLGSVGAAPPMKGAWGAAAAVRLDYSICKRDHLESYTVFASESKPRYMLREDMPNGLVSELIRVEP
jgi:hypothetical protein